VAELRWADGSLLPPVETRVAAATPSGEPEGDGNLTLSERGPAASGDVNADGLADLVLEAQESNFSGNSIVTLTGNPDGTFGQVVTSPGSGYSNAFTAADLDGDGNLDVLGSGSDTNVSTASLVAMYGLGDGSFEPRATLTSPTGYLKPVIDDVDRDGDLDISSLDVRGIPATLENRGSRQFGKPAGGDDGAPKPLGVVGGDFNEDGWPDLAISRDGHLELELNGLSGEIKQDRARLHVQVGKLAVPKSFRHLGIHAKVSGTCSSTCAVKLTVRVPARVSRRARLGSPVLASTRTRWAPHEDNSTDIHLSRRAVRALRHYSGRSFRILVLARGRATATAGNGPQRGSDRASVSLGSKGGGGS
jgi:VCBS repeat protein